MPVIPICDPNDSRVAAYMDLRDKELRAREGRFVAEGDFVVRRLLASDFEVESLLVAEGQVHRVDVPPNLPVFCAPVRLIEQVAGFPFHRGILGCGIRRPGRILTDLVPPVAEKASIVVCSAVRDPVNLGGILRNCAAFGVNLVILGNHSADPLARRVLRVSMATVLQLTIHESTQLERDLARLRDEFAVRFAATVLHPHAQPLADAERCARLGLVFGNEGDGLEESLAEQCESHLTIPMALQTDSLNVAVTSGIFLYHFNHLNPVAVAAQPDRGTQPAGTGERK